jgi:hypothetical protein
MFAIWALLMFFLTVKLGFVSFHTHFVLRGSNDALNRAFLRWLGHALSSFND